MEHEFNTRDRYFAAYLHTKYNGIYRGYEIINGIMHEYFEGDEEQLKNEYRTSEFKVFSEYLQDFIYRSKQRTR